MNPRTELSRWIVARRRRRVALPTPSEAADDLGGTDALPSDTPVFLLAGGWRTGSTLLQRLVVSSGDVLVWGEPFTFVNPVGRLGEMLPPIATVPRQWYLGANGEGDDHARQDIANLYPHPAAMLRAQRAFFRALFADPASEAGYPQWGIKEVRLGIEHARYLKKLFPGSRMVFIIRNPYDAFASYHGSLWYGEWPKSIRTPEQFGRHWAAVTSGLVDGAADVDALVVRYEELRDRSSVLDALDSHLGIQVDRTILELRIGSSRSSLSRSVRRRLARCVEPLAARLGY
jgi:hypothetical protein